MSRYYRIVITNPTSGAVVTPPGFSGLLGGATYTSFVNGRTLPEAWNIELDVPVIEAATPQGSALVRVWGVSNPEIGQANDLFGKNISIYAGMQKGLPLANPSQSGLIAQGYIFQAFGNCIGTARTLDLVVNPGTATPSRPGGTGTLTAPKNIVLNWPANSPLAASLKSALATAFPGLKINVTISADLVRPNIITGFYPTLETFSQWVRQTSLDIIKTPGYAGVSIVVANDAVTASDRTVASSSATTMISFQDLIGQPTWIQAPNIQVKTVMRADLRVGGTIKLPPTITTNSQQALSSLVNQRSSFQGEFDVVSLRHVGDFRAPQADAWVTVIEAAPRSQGAAR